jgi:hypothetical protein
MSENVKKIKDEVNKQLENAKALKASMDELDEWDSIQEIIQNFKKIGNFITGIVMAVEVAADNLKNELADLKSEEKLDAAVQVLDDKVKLPWYLEAIDGPTFKLVLSFAVFFLNGMQGSNWDLTQVRKALDEGLDKIGFNVQ